ncbi:hypothetical protein RND71_019249 [Anisodus tanguticus]|uniref:Uncharacterized protein n=1 Tax=Anisodus tanguticus TaxID=243964 RepID=A0AAE1RZ39_9SOLA|nr:hypothetical protein RND71_019249 [Anisodus tanguticus]
MKQSKQFWPPQQLLTSIVQSICSIGSGRQTTTMTNGTVNRHMGKQPILKIVPKQFPTLIPQSKQADAQAEVTERGTTRPWINLFTKNRADANDTPGYNMRKRYRSQNWSNAAEPHMYLRDEGMHEKAYGDQRYIIASSHQPISKQEFDQACNIPHLCFPKQRGCVPRMELSVEDRDTGSAFILLVATVVVEFPKQRGCAPRLELSVEGQRQELMMMKIAAALKQAVLQDCTSPGVS